LNNKFEETAEQGFAKAPDYNSLKLQQKQVLFAERTINLQHSTPLKASRARTRCAFTHSQSSLRVTQGHALTRQSCKAVVILKGTLMAIAVPL
jgi:hypothetical protein